MNIKYLLLTFALFSLLACGCQKEENPTSAGEPKNPPSIELRAQQYYPETFRGKKGTVCLCPILAILRNADGAAIPNPTITFSILDPQPWKGGFVFGDSLANHITASLATYQVTLEKTGTVTIEARSGLILSFLTIELDVIIPPAHSINLEIEPDTIHSWGPQPHGYSFLTAVVRDSVNQVIYGAPVKFDILEYESWKGEIFRADSLTNKEGEAYAEYRVYFEQIGEVVFKTASGDLFEVDTLVLMW